MPRMTQKGYKDLAAFRYEIRKFLAFSEEAARSAGVEPQQHQLLLALRGLPDGSRPTIGTIAERLCVKHHTAVGIVDKLEQRHLLLRERSSADRREVMLVLTEDGEALLAKLSVLHKRQLAEVGPLMVAALGAILGGELAAASGLGVAPERAGDEPAEDAPTDDEPEERIAGSAA